jgi:hypothetical protein
LVTYEDGRRFLDEGKVNNEQMKKEEFTTELYGETLQAP